MTYQIEVRERPAQATLGIRTHSAVQDLPKVIPTANYTIAQYLETLGQHPSGAPFAAYYNMDMQNLDVEIGFLSTKNVPGKGNIQPGSLPGGKAASCLHVGPYTGVGNAHTALHDWMREKGYENMGAYYEIYLN